MACGLLGRTAGFVLLCVLFIAIAALCVALSIYDMRERRLPNRLVAPLALLCVGWAFVSAPDIATLGLSLVWGILTALFLGGFELLWRHLRGSHGIGSGDIKVLAAFAFALREAVFLLLALACVCALIVESLRGRSTFAFGPYLCACGCVLLLMMLAFA